jgi:hypothetical protein
MTSIENGERKLGATGKSEFEVVVRRARALGSPMARAVRTDEPINLDMVISIIECMKSIAW